MQTSQKTLRINDKITSPEVMVIDEKGNKLGVMNIKKAIQAAIDAGFDLVEVSPNTNPPVCKIANFGKMKYEMQKKASDSKKKQKLTDTKEVKMSFNIGKGDYEVKVKKIIQFIQDGHKVKVSTRMKGREITHTELVTKMMESLIKDVEDFAKPESVLKSEGRQIVVTFIKK